MKDSPCIRWSDDSFTATPATYREFVRAARLRPLIAQQIRRLRTGTDVAGVGAAIRTAFVSADVPPGSRKPCGTLWFTDAVILSREARGVDHFSPVPAAVHQIAQADSSGSARGRAHRREERT